MGRIAALMEIDLPRAGRAAMGLARRFPENYDVLMFRGLVNMRMRRHDLALNALKQAAQLKPNNHYVHFNIGLCLLRAHRLDPALQSFKKASRHAPRDVYIAHVLMAICHHRLGKPRDAVRVLRRLVLRSPNITHIRYCLILALRDVNAHEEADRHARTLSALLDADFRIRRRFLHFFQTYDHAAWDIVDNKVSLHRLIRQHSATVDRENVLQVPDGYVMPGDYEALNATHRENPSVWIVKPENLHTGQGIRLIDNPKDAPRKPGWLVQRYLDKPFLIHGRKANIRLCVVFTSYVPLRAYLYRGASARIALQEYEPGPVDIQKLAMHIDQRSRFVLPEYEDELAETAALTGSEYNLLQNAELMKIIEAAGHDTDNLWQDLTALVKTLVKVMAAAGIFRAQAVPGCAHAYFPKVLSLDIFLDETLRPWLVEVERNSAKGRMFDGQTGDNPVFRDLFDLFIFPYLTAADAQDDSYRIFRDSEVERRHFHRLEHDRCGRFMPLHEEQPEGEPIGASDPGNTVTG